MNVVFRGPENEIITAGFGALKKGVPKEIADRKYAYDLMATGRCDPADEATKAEYVAMRKEAIDGAAATSKGIYCDQCLNEISAKELLVNGCPFCATTKVRVEDLSSIGSQVGTVTAGTFAEKEK